MKNSSSIKAFMISFIITLVIVLGIGLTIGDFKIREEAIIIHVGEAYYPTKATWVGFDVTDKVEISDDLDTSKVGTYNVTYKFGILQAHQQVNVVDTAPPILTLEGEMELIVDNMQYFQDPGYQAFDEYDGDITKKVVRQIVPFEGEANKYYVIYSVEDSSGNSAIEHRIVYAKPSGELS